ncbi:MAG TPA: cytochrome C biogenesis protein [Elusimicrobia bacterium]|nr:cytochrome C biogenesis protein [Elusimicrobiota bacterium]
MVLGAFLAGLASFLSPCVLPLVPVYLAYLAGTDFEGLRTQTPRRLVLLHAGFFILGFSLVFIALGASASALGAALWDYRVWLERAGGVVLVLLGLWMLGLFKAAFLYRDARFRFHDKPAGLAGSVLVGAAFAAGWTPCVGPILASILMMASQEGSVSRGVLLLAVYSAGFALPLLACALALDRAMKLLKRVNPYLPAIERVVGGVIVALGALLAAGKYSQISAWVMAKMAVLARLSS